MAAPCSAFSRQVVAFNASLHLGYEVNWNFSPQVLVDINVDTFVLCFVYKQYRIVGNFRGRKLSKISRFCGYTRMFSPQNLGRGILWHSKSEQSAKVFSQKSYSLQICESFLPQKFPTIQYCSMFQSSDHSPVTE